MVLPSAQINGLGIDGAGEMPDVSGGRRAPVERSGGLLSGKKRTPEVGVDIAFHAEPLSRFRA